MPDDDENTRCRNCGYEWEYSGSMDMSSCPNCNRKTPTENIDEEANT